MRYVIDKEKRPAYLQLYTALREDIVNGVYPYRTKLPSKRALAAETGLSTVTVEHALALLCDEGYACAKERSGFLVSFRQGDGFAAPAKSAPSYPLSRDRAHDDPDFPLSVLSQTMRRVLAEHGELLLEKSPNLGCTELREALKENGIGRPATRAEIIKTLYKRNYIQKKRQVILVLDPEEHESIKSYCEAKGMSMNSFIKEIVLEKVREG